MSDDTEYSNQEAAVDDAEALAVLDRLVALAAERSLLDVVRVHHLVLAEVLAAEPAEGVPAVARAASDFLLEVLASYDMARREPRRPS
jgi:hypothetical protein